jgi:DNA-binding NarL/FixJ family response regulator
VLTGTGSRANLVDILIAHTDNKARSALRLFLAQDPCLQVAGTAENGQELLHLAASSRPDLVLLDWRLVGQPASELLAALRTLDGDLKLIAMVSRLELHEAAQRAGMHGIINLWEPPQRVLTVIHALMYEDGGGR